MEKVWLLRNPGVILGDAAKANAGGKYVSLDLVRCHWPNFGGDCEIGDACPYDDLLDDRARHYRIDPWRRHHPYVFAPEKRTLSSCRPDIFHPGRGPDSLHLLQAEDSFSPGRPFLASRMTRPGMRLRRSRLETHGARWQ